MGQSAIHVLLHDLGLWRRGGLLAIAVSMAACTTTAPSCADGSRPPCTAGTSLTIPATSGPSALHYVGEIAQTPPLPSLPLDLTLFFGAPRSTAAVGHPQSSTFDVTGSYIAGTGSSAFNGTVSGTLTNYVIDGGTFNGVLTATTSGGCVAQRNYTGPLTSAALNWAAGAPIETCGGASPLTFSVTLPSAPPAASRLSLDPLSQSVPAAGQSGLTANVISNVIWTATSDQSWLTITSGASGAGNGTVTYAAAANTVTASRSAHVTVSGDGASATLTVSQAAAPNSIVVTPATQSVGTAGQSGLTVTVTANVSWTAASNQPWLTITAGASGSGNGTITYAAAANPVTAARSAQITVSGGGISATLTVNQTAASSSIAVAPTTQDVPAAGQAGLTTAVTANISWTATSDQSWLTITAGASGSGNGTVTYSAAANSGTAARSAHITVSGGGTSAQLTVNQAGTASSILVNPATQSVAAAGQAGLTTTVTANVAWTASSDQSWVTITGGASGSGNATITYTAAANSGTATRSAHITVSGGGTSAQLTVNQAGTASSILVSPVTQSVAATGQAGLTTAVTANVAWTATSDQSWLTITSGTSGSGNGTITYTAAANSGTATRSAHITASGSGTSAILTVNQSGVEVSIAVNPTTQAVVAGGQAGLTTAVTANVSWTASSDQSWLTITAGTSGSGNGTITYTAASNTATGAAARSAHITVSGSGASAQLTVNQAAGSTTGTLSGTISNASNGQPVGGAIVAVGSLSATTNSSGVYTISNVPAGTQSVQTSASGFATRTDTVSITAGTTTTFSVALVPNSSAGNITIVLNWGAQPPDLDAHLTGPNTAGGRFHLYFGDKTPVSYASLDVDDTTGFGPETVTISPVSGSFVAGSYSFYVDNFSGLPGFDVSNGSVTVFQGGVQIRQFLASAATGSPAAANWSVFTLTLTASGQPSITAVQQFTATAPAGVTTARVPKKGG